MSSPFQPHAASPEELLAHFETERAGLSPQERQKRLERWGSNVLEETAARSRWSILWAQFSDVLILLLLGATVVSAGLGEYLDASVMLSIVLLSAALGFLQELRAEKALAALQQMTAPRARIRLHGKLQEIDASELVPGDILWLEAGDRVPADARLLEQAELRADESSLTGESLPVEKQLDVLPHEAIVSEQKNMCFLGSNVVHGEGLAVVCHTGMNTQMGQIAHSLQQPSPPQTPLQVKFERLARQIGLVCLMAIAVVFVATMLGRPETVSFKDHAVQMLIFALSLAVAAVPSSLPAIVTIGLAMGTKSLAQHQMIVKRLPAAEALGSVTFICSDKTGTLTKNEMTATQLYSQGQLFHITGTGYAPQGECQLDGQPCPEGQLPRKALEIGAWCNNAQFQSGEDGERELLGDPTEGALRVACEKVLPGLQRPERVDELPFDSERKRMSVVLQTEAGYELQTKGAPEVILDGSSHIYEADGSIRPIAEADRQAILEARDQMASQALRVLGLGFRSLQGAEDRSEEGLAFVGLVGMIDPLREEAKASIGIAHKAGIQVMMITGDHAKTAEAIGRSLGLSDSADGLLTGRQLEQMDDAALLSQLEGARIIARALPKHKLRIVKMLQQKGHVVAMTGDGVNDAPALKQADIGVAMGQAGTDVAKEASDAILVDDRFDTIVRAIEEGRNIYDKMLKSTRYLLSCNVGEVFAVFLAVLFRMPLPLLPLQILLMNLVTDGLPALALGAEPSDPQIMERPPRDPKANPLDRATLGLIGVFGLVMAAGTLVLFALYQSEGIDKARTVAFTALVLFEMFAVFSARRLQAFSSLNPLTNPWLVLAVCSSLLLHVLIVYWPPLQKLFHTKALTATDLGLIAAVASLGFFSMEVGKWLVARFEAAR